MAPGVMAFLSEEDQPVPRPLLRAAGPEETDEGPRTTGRADSPRGTVLVADDDEAVRSTVTDILRLAHYEVLQAANGDEALQVLGRQPVDVLILDLHMPVRDGLSVLEALGPPPPKVILVSVFAHYSPEDIDGSGLGSKVTRSLRKPCAPVELLAAVNDALDELHRED